jgi:HEAT repeat protein
MRFRRLRQIFMWSLIPLAIASALYIALSGSGDPRLVLTTLILGIFGLIEPISIILDRLPGREAPKTNTQGNRTVEDYLNGRLREFGKEEALFVKLAGTTVIAPSYKAESRTLDDISKAVTMYDGRFVLIGDPGAGKSTTLRRLITDAIHNYQRNSTEYPLPVWINLGLSSTPVEAEKLLEYWWDQQCFLPDAPEKYIKQNNLWLFMDGLNEMPLDSRNERAKELREFLVAHPQLPVIVTCRVRDYDDEEALRLVGLPVVYVQPLDDSRIQEFIDNRQREDSAKGLTWDHKALWSAIQARDALKHMAQNPYNLTMLIAVYRTSGAIPNNLHELYREYLAETYKTYTLERTKLHSPLTTLLQLPWQSLERRLKRLAFQMLTDGKGMSAGRDWVIRQIGKKALQDALNMGVLIYEGSSIRFYHQSLQGYFAIESLGRALKGEIRFDGILRLITYDRAMLIRAIKTRSWVDIRQRRRMEFVRQMTLLGENAAPAVESFFIALYDVDVDVRFAAAAALGFIGDAITVDLLMAALNDTNRNVQSGAAIALGLKKHSSAIGSLITMLGDSDEFVVASVAGALINIGEPSIPPLIAAFSADDEFVRAAAALILRKIGNPAIPSLITALGDANKTIQIMASTTLGKIGEPAIQPLIAALSDANETVRLAAGAALIQIGEPAIQLLITALSDANETVRLAAGAALIQIGEPAIQLLITAFSDTNRDIKSYSTLLLSSICEPAIQPLIMALGHANKDIRTGSMVALRDIGEPAVQPLIMVIDEVDHNTRLHVATALQEIGTPEALEALRKRGLL